MHIAAYFHAPPCALRRVNPSRAREGFRVLGNYWESIGELFGNHVPEPLRRRYLLRLCEKYIIFPVALVLPPPSSARDPKTLFRKIALHIFGG